MVYIGMEHNYKVAIMPLLFEISNELAKVWQPHGSDEAIRLLKSMRILPCSTPLF